MDQKSLPTLLHLAIKSLLSNEPAAIQALRELPRDIFVPLFTCAFLGRKKEVLKSMVQVWPFYCMHIGSLNIGEAPYEILEALVDGLHLLPAQNSPQGKTDPAVTKGSKLRILDLGQDGDHGIVCTSRVRHPFCLQSCANTRHSNLRVNEAQRNFNCVDMATSGPLPVRKHIELVMDISFNSTLRTEQFLSFLKRKVEQSYGSLHLCCRNLQLDNFSEPTGSLKIFDPACIIDLKVNQSHLKKVITLLPQLTHLKSLNLNYVPFTFCKGRHFRTFLTWLGQMNNLDELNLSFFCLRDQLHKLLRVLRPQLEILNLSCCYLSTKDIISLSQSSQFAHLKLLNLSHNQIVGEVYESLKTLLERISSTLQCLELKNCHITDTALSYILPALSHCSCLQVFSFNSNLITIPALMDLLQYLIALTELKCVILPIPIDCYEQWDINGILNQQKLVAVQNQVKLMLQAARRDVIYWITFPQ